VPKLFASIFCYEGNYPLRPVDHKKKKKKIETKSSLYKIMNTNNKALDYLACEKHPSFLAPGPSGVSRNGTRAGSEEGRLFLQATIFMEISSS